MDIHVGDVLKMKEPPLWKPDASPVAMSDALSGCGHEVMLPQNFKAEKSPKVYAERRGGQTGGAPGKGRRGRGMNQRSGAAGIQGLIPCAPGKRTRTS